MKRGAFKPARGTGDLGFTDLFGRRVPKTHRRVRLNAALDELSALMGLLKACLRDRRLRAELTDAQAGLVKAAGAIAGAKAGLEAETAALERTIERRSASVRPPRKFVLPGASEAEALAHLARTRARACEIIAWELKASGPAVYLNRLSDYLFLAALGCPRK